MYSHPLARPRTLSHALACLRTVSHVFARPHTPSHVFACPCTMLACPRTMFRNLEAAMSLLVVAVSRYWSMVALWSLRPSQGLTVSELTLLLMEAMPRPQASLMGVATQPELWWPSLAL